MRIEVQRSGGFTGVSAKGSVDTAELPPEVAAELEALVSRLNLSELAGRDAPRDQRGADQFQYDVVVEDAKGRHEISLRERDMPPELRQLVTRVLKQSRREGS
jgi:hypothetical protein